MAKTWEAAQIARLESPKARQGEIKEEFNLRFNLIKELVKNLKSEADILQEAEKLQGRALSKIDEDAVKLRIKYVKIWLEKFGEKAPTLEVGKKKEMSDKQKELLQVLAKDLSEEMSEDEVQNFIYNKGKDLGLKPAETFQAVYLVLLGKDQGPKAGVLIKSVGLAEVKKKFSDV